jgi:phosphate transport system substrate-binding protein
MRTLLGVVVVLAGLVVASSSVRADDLKGEIKIDGSSTVYLISEAMATHFKKSNPKVQVSVGISGTGGGFKKFMAGETDISDASRPIKPAEIEGCKKAGIEYVEFQVAWDGITVVVHPENSWAKKMTVAQLKKIWNPDTPAKMWSDVDPSWPKEEIKLFGPGPDSGTFDYFTEAINGMERVTRKDYEASQNPDVLVKGVAGNKYALGYFGLAYFEDNKDKLASVAVAAKEGGDFVLPSKETVLKQTYKPLSRPLYIYVKKASFKRPEVQEFVRFYLRRNDLVEQAKYIPTTALQRSTEQEKFEGALKDLK